MNDDDYDPLNETDPEVRSLRAELRRQAAELVRLQAVLFYQPVVQGDILIKKAAHFDQVFADQQQARDDWK